MSLFATRSASLVATLAALAPLLLTMGCDVDRGGANTAKPTPTGPPPITDIPAAALLQPEDLGPDGYVAQGAVFDPSLNPCGGISTEADSLQVTRTSMVGVFKQPRSGDLIHVVTSYRDGGAEAYMAEVRENIVRCAELVVRGDPYEEYGFDGTTHWEATLVAEEFAGDDSLIYSRASWEVWAGVVWRYTSLCAIMRLGDVVIVVDVRGNEGPGENLATDRQDLDRFAAAAMDRAAAALPAAERG